MSQYYAFITTDEGRTLLEFQYDMYGGDEIILRAWHDCHGETPELSWEQEQLIINDIRRFEYQRPLENIRQQRLAEIFTHSGIDYNPEEYWCECREPYFQPNYHGGAYCEICGGRVQQ